MKTDGSKESENYNKKFLRLYYDHPTEFAQAVMKGIYKASSTVYNAVLKDDYERFKVLYDNYENVRTSFDEVHIKAELRKDDGGLTEELKNSNSSKLLQIKNDMWVEFKNPRLFFEIPKLTDEQLEICVNNSHIPGFTSEYGEIAISMLTINSFDESKKTVKLLQEKGIFDDKEPLLSFKAIETKNGEEKEISLIEAVTKNDLNIKIVRRSEEEKEKMLYITNGFVKKKAIQDAKDSLALHHNAVKEYLEFSRQAKNHEEKRFDKTYDAYLGLNCINNAINFINKKSDEWFENKEDVLNIAKQNGFEIENGRIKKFDSGFKSKGLENINLEFFDKIEKIIKTDAAIELSNAIKGDGNLFERTHVHVFDEKINEIKNSIPESFTKEEKEEYIKALDNINAKVFRKNDENFMEQVIDGDGQIIKMEAKSGFSKFAESLNVSEEDKKVLVQRDKEKGEFLIDFRIDTQEQYETFANVDEKRPRIGASEETKDKIKKLSKVVDETGIFNLFGSGETGAKGYGFSTFFKKQEELNKLLKKDISAFTDEEKKEYSKELIKKSNELNELEEKYDKVLNYINDNFDFNNISINENVYSGRPFLDVPVGILEKWDYKNARAGVILNGLAQVYGTAKEAGVSVDKVIDNPEKAMKLFMENRVKDVKKTVILPKEGNSLGKRLARATYYNRSDFQRLDSATMVLARTIEFMSQVDLDKNRAIQNLQLEAFVSKGLLELNKSSINYLNMDPASFSPVPNYNNLINILMFGDDAKENILETCEGFYNSNFKKVFNPNYMDKYKQMIKNPGEVFNNITNMIKDYFKESEIIYKELDDLVKKSDNIYYIKSILPEHIVVASKVMLENMLKANNMTIEDIKDPIARENIQNYLDNPTKVISNMLKDELGFDDKRCESFEDKIQNAINDYSKSRANTLKNKYNDRMTQTDNNIKEKTITGMIKNHKIGFFENLFNTKATKNYRNLVNAINGLSNKESEYYGKPEKVALAAQAYLDHKYQNGKTINNLSGEAKQRAIFCENLLKVYKNSFSAEVDFNLNNEPSFKIENANNQKEVENNILNEKANVIAEQEPERESVLGLETDTNIEKGNKKVQKAKEERANEKSNEKIQDMNQAAK